jgi:hypothetical protein
MQESARYLKIVEWSDTDQCFIGSWHDLFCGRCHETMNRRSLLNSAISQKK